MSLRLLPAPRAVALAACTGEGVDQALRHLGMVRVPDWPHADTADALRPLAEHPDVVSEGPGTFLVLDADTVVGDGGWFGPPGTDGSVEIGYGLALSVRGRGWGTAAVGLLLAWAQAQPGVAVVRAEVLPGNATSLAVLHRLGFTIDGLLSGHVQLSLATLGPGR